LRPKDDESIGRAVWPVPAMRGPHVVNLGCRRRTTTRQAASSQHLANAVASRHAVQLSARMDHVRRGGARSSRGGATCRARPHGQDTARHVDRLERDLRGEVRVGV